jgi:hypothetical protein
MACVVGLSFNVLTRARLHFVTKQEKKIRCSIVLHLVSKINNVLVGKGEMG